MPLVRRWLLAALCLGASAPVRSLRTPPSEQRLEPNSAKQAQRRWGPERAAIRPSSVRVGSYETIASWTSKHGSADMYVSAYKVLSEALSADVGLSHSAHILEYVSGRPDAPLLSRGGCLYLPRNSVWMEFYDSIHHPDPRLFTELIAASFYPDCSLTSLHGMEIWHCPREGEGATVAMRIQGTSSCIDVEQASLTFANVTVLASDGMIGLPAKWRNHLYQVEQRRVKPRSEQLAAAHTDRCRSPDLAEVPPGHRLVIPARYVICMASNDRQGVDEALIWEQNNWTNQGYAGRSPWNMMSFEKLADAPPQADMQIEFEMAGVTFVHDQKCARDSFYDYSAVEKYISNGDKEVTIVLVGGDESGILGMSPLPMESDILGYASVVLVSQEGLRRFSSIRGSDDLSYDEGDTVTHEAGHFFGLYHTFQDGCARSGDLIDDTNPEELPRYTCSNKDSCGSPDPIHNFMDYTPDGCMTGFTEQQKRRAWCVIEKYRPTLYRNSLRTG